MDNDGLLILAGFIGFILGVAVLFAQFRLFSIDSTLKQILARLPAAPQQNIPIPIERVVTSTTDQQLEQALKGK
ncbi:MAG TPA: hypothetical protein VLN58_09265 [Verrucomicrobiae bacterium]|nr:hypothetical protein [Verrucomicrobiae bacterium]